MIATRIAACLLLACSLRLTAEQPTSLPPPPAADMAGATATWSQGHWLWTGSQWSWCPGSWQISRAAVPPARWIEGHWMAGPAGTAWVPGHWQDGAAGGSVSAPAATVAYDPSRAPPQQQPAVPTSQAAVYTPPASDETVYVDRPVTSTTVVVAPAYAPVYASVYAPPCVPLCAPCPVVVGGGIGRPFRLPLPPLLPLPFAGHHGFGFGRLPFFNPLSFLFHHR